MGGSDERSTDSLIELVVLLHVCKGNEDVGMIFTLKDRDKPACVFVCACVKSLLF